MRELSVRGCVRVTGTGVEAVVEGCNRLEIFDVSQCKNLNRWLDMGGEEASRRRWRNPKLQFIKEKAGDGSFR